MNKKFSFLLCFVASLVVKHVTSADVPDTNGGHYKVDVLKVEIVKPKDQYSATGADDGQVAASDGDLSAAPTSYHGHGGGSDSSHRGGYNAKKYDGGYKHGHDEWDKGHHKKHGEEWGKYGHQKHGHADKWADKHHNNHGLHKHGDKWSDAHGAKKGNSFSQWADNQKWHKDKGHGLVKTWDWDKSDGHKDAYGKKGHHNDHYYKQSHGHKDGIKKWQDSSANKHGQKHADEKKDWKDYGKTHGDSGDKQHGHKKWSHKGPQWYGHHKETKYHKSHKGGHGGGGHGGGGQGGDYDNDDHGSYGGHGHGDLGGYSIGDLGHGSHYSHGHHLDSDHGHDDHDSGYEHGGGDGDGSYYD